eukprot:3274385-Pyramimonas_sp.AAC.1
MSELGLLLELGLRNYSYSIDFLDSCRRFLYLTRAVGELQSWYVEKPIQNRQTRSSEASRGLLLELGLRDYSYSTDLLTDTI